MYKQTRHNRPVAIEGQDEIVALWRQAVLGHAAARHALLQRIMPASVIEMPPVIIDRPATTASREENTMRWEQWFCPNQDCAGWEWMVQRDPATRDVWWVAADVEETPFMVAATDPVCPSCGATLYGMIETSGGRAEPAVAETGPVFDFVRSLA
jgi:hypothetical protein